MGDLINSVTFTKTITPAESTDAPKLLNGLPLPLLIAIDLVATFILFALPMLVYRFIILRRPLTKTKAKKIAALDGLALGLLLAIYIIYSGNYYIAIGILWSLANYFILTCPKLRYKNLVVTAPLSTKANDQAEIPTVSNTSDMNTSKNCKNCKNCYAVNLATSKTCFYCGAIMEDDEKE